MARVLVTDAHLGSAISIIRSLGRGGHEVTAAGFLPRSAGFYSRYAGERFVYPRPEDDAPAMVDALFGAVEDRKIDVLIPVTDDVITPLSRERRRFEAVCTLAVAENEALAVARDKTATLELAEALEIPVPRTATVSSVAQAAEAAADVGWPIVLKPQSSRVVRADGRIDRLLVSYASTPAELDARMQELEGICPVLLQEYYAGEGHGVELLLHQGRPLVAFQHKRLREVPITGGASSFRISVPLDPVLYDFSVRLLRELQWTGLAMVEFKLGHRGPLLMEINGRVWGSLPLALRSGVDFPLRLVDMLVTGAPASVRPAAVAYPAGVRSRNVELEVVWIGSVLRKARRYPFITTPSRLAAIRVGLRLLVPADGYDILDRNDPRPGLVDLLRLPGKLRGKLSDLMRWRRRTPIAHGASCAPR